MSWPSCLTPRRRHRQSEHNTNRRKKKSNSNSVDGNSLNPKTMSYTFYDLAHATRKFSESNLIGQGGFGKVFKGILKGQLVAVKQLGHNGTQGHQEFLMEVLMLSFLDHPNLVNLMGYCAEGDQRILVYEYLPNGSLDDHLFGKITLDWNTRIKIAIGVARGLEYLHCKADPPVIHRDLKPANVLLDAEYNAKLSDFGLAKLGPVGVKTHVSTRVMGTCGYCAPDYAKSGCLTLESDIYSFGVVLLEIITGRRAFDPNRGQQEQDLVAWARPLLRNQRKYVQLVDPRLQGCFAISCLCRLVAVTAMCLMEERKHRPLISDVLLELEHLASRPYKSEAHVGGYLSTPSSPMLRGIPLSPRLQGTQSPRIQGNPRRY